MEEAIAKNLYSDAQIASSEQNIRQMQTMLRAMRVLYEEKISYASAVQYGDFDRENGASVAVFSARAARMCSSPRAGQHFF